MEKLKHQLLAANLELYGEEPGTLRLAERHRYHLMDAGVTLRANEDAFVVSFVARAQRTDFPHVEQARVFAAIKTHFGGTAYDRGYRASGDEVREIRDPMDEQKVLDVWYETTFSRELATREEAIAEARWALGIEKYVRPE